jgi:chromosome partitioning protein
MSAQIIAVCNQKGGVGKTTVTAGLAEVLAHRLRKRVLLVDIDPQFNATSNMGVSDAEFTLNDVLAGGEGSEVIPGVMADAAVHASSDWQADADKGQDWPVVHLVASERALAGREQDQMMGREHRLRIALDGATEAYDVVLLDCPPSLGQLTINALVAADAALLVTEPRAASVEGLSEIVKTLGSVRQLFNPGLSLAGIVVNRVSKRKLDQAEWIEKLEADYGPQLLPPYLPEREAFAKANSAAVPLSNYGTSGRELLDSLEEIARTITKEH